MDRDNSRNYLLILENNFDKGNDYDVICNNDIELCESDAPFDKHVVNCGIAITRELPFQCSVCNRQFTTQRRYSNYIDGGCKYNIPCDHCGHIFSSKFGLEYHINSGKCNNV